MPKRKACLIILRSSATGPELLLFRHPLAGMQLVKGGVEQGEHPEDGARRELAEESGLYLTGPLTHLGPAAVWRFKTTQAPTWELYAAHVAGPPNQWDHWCTDDGGHMFRFSWHPLGAPITNGERPFEDARKVAQRNLAGRRFQVQVPRFSPAPRLGARR